MSADPASSGSILLAWAVPVDLAWLGARLFAYVRTKATITTLRLVSKNSPLTACRSLPEEIISLIAIEVREMVFQLKIDDWVKFTTYLSSWRLTQVRLFDTDLKNLCSMAQVDWCDEGYEELSAVDSLVNAESHPENLELMCKFLTDTEGTTLAKCSQVRITPFVTDTQLIHLLLDLRSGLCYPPLPQIPQILRLGRESSESRRGQSIPDFTASEYASLLQSRTGHGFIRG